MWRASRCGRPSTTLSPWTRSAAWPWPRSSSAMRRPRPRRSSCSKASCRRTRCRDRSRQRRRSPGTGSTRRRTATTWWAATGACSTRSCSGVRATIRRARACSPWRPACSKAGVRSDPADHGGVLLHSSGDGLVMRYLWLVGTVLAAAVAPLGAQDVGLAVGTKAPVVAVEDLDGKSVDLGQYIGRQPVVLEFWATWCPLCKALEPSLKAAHARYGRTVRFVAIGVGVNQSAASIKRHLAAH